MTSKPSAKRDLVLSTIIMRLTTEQALEFIKDKGYSISRSNFFRLKGQLNKDKLKNLYSIAKNFDSFHLERLNEIQEVRRLLWQNYNECKNPYQKSQILREIRDLQPYLSSYLEATKLLIEHKQIQELGSKKKRKKLNEVIEEDQQN